MGNETPPSAPWWVRRRRTVWVCAILFFVTVCGLTLAYRHFTSPERIRSLAESYLQQYLRGRVSVGSASFSWMRGLKLFDVAVAEPPSSTADGGSQTSKEPVFFCREIRLTHDSLSALWGDMKIQSITAISPTCLIARDSSTGRTNIQGLLLATRVPETSAATGWPRVELKDARVRVVSRDETGSRLIEDLSLNVRALPSKRGPLVYDIVWQEKSGRVASGQSQIDLQTGAIRNVRDGLPWMSIEAVMLVINAGYDGVGAWSDLLGLDGTVRVRDYQFPSGTSGDEPRSATIELDNASLSIPISGQERTLSPDERYLSFESVRGHVQLTGRDIHAVFSGTFHGSRCDVSMTLRAGEGKLTTLDDVHLDARLVVQDLNLPRSHAVESESEARFVHRWGGLAKIYHDFDPKGVVDLDVAVTKSAGKDEPIHVRRMDLVVKSGSGMFRRFPYRVFDLEGTFSLTSEEFVVRNLHGRHGDGEIRVDAQMKNLTRSSRKTVTIKGKNISADEDLYRAIPPQFKKLWDRFDPSGTVDVLVELTQPELTPDMPMQWVPEHTITVLDLAASYEGFAYLVENLQGTLLIAPDRFEIKTLRGRAGTATVQVDGLAKIANKEMVSLDLSIRAQNVPFGDALRTALPPEAAKWVDSFHPRGTFDLETKVVMDSDTRRVTQTSDVSLNGITGWPETFPAKLSDVLGHLRITPDEILIEGVTGRFQEGAVSIDGLINVTADLPSYALTVRSREIQLDAELRAALPRDAREALADWAIDGPFDTDTIITGSSEDGTPNRSISTTATMEGVRLSHIRMPQPLTDVHMTVSIDDTGVHAENFLGQYGPATVEGSFDILNQDAGDAGKITLTAKGLVLDQNIRQLWPGEFATHWDRLGPSGTVDLVVDRLDYRRAAPDAAKTWSVKGRADLLEVNLTGVADLQEMTGAIHVQGMLFDRLGGTSLRGQLDLEALRTMGQPLRQMEAMWSFVRTSNGEGMFELNQIRGTIHEGMISGQIGVDFDRSKTQYSLSMRIQSMQLHPFAQADHKEHYPGKPPLEVRGIADATLHLSGLVGEPESMRGGGRIDIREANIYRTPIMLAILHVLNLSVPNESSIKDVKVDFLVTGRRVYAEEIELNGDVIALLGSGTMSLPDRGLDLRLVHVNPKQRVRVPVLTDVIEGASRGLVELHVTGPLSQPTVKIRPFGGITEELKKLIQRRKPKPAKSVQPGR